MVDAIIYVLVDGLNIEMVEDEDESEIENTLDSGKQERQVPVRLTDERR